MAAYATVVQLVRFGLPASIAAELDTETKEEALEAASRWMDTYFVKAGFSVPIATPNQTHAECAAVLAGYSLMSNLGLNPENVDENIRLRYTDKIKWLQYLAGGAGEGSGGGGDSTHLPTVYVHPTGFRLVSSSSRGYSSRGGGSGGGFTSD